MSSLIDDFEPRSTSAPPHLQDRWEGQLVSPQQQCSTGFLTTISPEGPAKHLPEVSKTTRIDSSIPSHLPGTAMMRTQHAVRILSDSCVSVLWLDGQKRQALSSGKPASVDEVALPAVGKYTWLCFSPAPSCCDCVQAALPLQASFRKAA